MSQLSYMTPGVVGFTDRRTRLLVMGILILVAGIICLLMAMLMPLMLMLPRPPGANAPGPQAMDIVPGMLLYIALAGLAIALAVGMMRVRRWVRPVILCACTIWMLIGVGAMVLMCITVPRMLTMMKVAGGTGAPVVPRGVAIAIVTGTLLFMFVLYLVVPALLMLAVRSRDVQATLEFFDPEPRWTDGVPLIVLGLSMACVLGGLATLFAMPRGLFLLFGVALVGWPGRIALSVVVVVFLVTAKLIFERNRVGWWLLVISTIILPISWIITLLRVDLAQIYEQMGMNTAQLQAMNIDSAGWVGTMVGQTVMLSVVLVALAWKARRHFETQTA
jgi:hypothetical protein